MGGRGRASDGDGEMISVGTVYTTLISIVKLFRRSNWSSLNLISSIMEFGGNLVYNRSSQGAIGQYELNVILSLFIYKGFHGSGPPK